MTGHKTRFIQFGDHEAEVDRGIADLILSLWQLGIETCNSCENNVPKGFVWIEFLTATDAENFLDIVANPYEHDYNSLYQHIMRYWRPIDSRKEEQLLKTDWIYTVHPNDLNVDMDEETNEMSRPGPAAFMLSVSIRFPRKHLAQVMARVQDRLTAESRLTDHTLGLSADAPSA